jgi:hypothetical protein
MCEEIRMRKCNRCGKEKPLTTEYYYAEKTAKDGFRTICKDCTKNKYKNNKDFDILTWYNNKSEKFKNEWIYEDIKWLYDNYLNITKQILKDKFPNKSYKTITNIIYQWDIRKITKNEDWSDEDINFLKENYKNMTDKELKQKFPNRTDDAIRNKTSKLGLFKTEETIFKAKSESHKGYIMSEERKRQISRNNRRENNYNWKGGLTPLITYFRGILYEWKLDSLKNYDYKCALTKTNDGDLEIHHSKENFSDIVYETLNKLNLPIYENMLQYSEDELNNINKTFIELHNQYGLGIPLKKDLHKLFHTIYGLTNNTEEQFEEFKQRYFDGEFDEALKITEEDIKLKERKRRTYRKLKEDEVREIRKLLDKGFPTEYIAKEYGVRSCAIYNIKINKTWKNVS